ncbi:hypothetical protein SeMB42_g03796 [Synchytrium endobioticum]|uniref:Uncharacterized protein n=1 Tax=Synchytrium endobioticum TaxID=286115 RepID=A0A507D433_9FUNG|nr:hypothetical protein SeMB42_g03796 [Synchytrium endobioticum]
MPVTTRSRMARAPRPRWVRTDGRLVRIDDERDAQLVEERQRHLADRIKAHGDQEAVHAGDAAGSRPRRRPRAGCVQRTNTSQNRSTTMKKRPATRTTTTRTRQTTPPPPPSPSPPPPPPQTPPLRLLPWEEPVEHPPPAFTVPDPTNLEFHYPDDDTDAGDAPYAYIQPDVEAYQRLPIDLRESTEIYVDRMGEILGPYASTEAKKLMASITKRCLTTEQPQGLQGLRDIIMGAAAVAVAYDDSSPDVLPDIAAITGFGIVMIGRLQKVVLRLIGYRV